MLFFIFITLDRSFEKQKNTELKTCPQAVFKPKKKNPDFGFLPDPVLHVSLKNGRLSIKLSKNVVTYKSSLKRLKQKKIKLIIVIFQTLGKSLLFSHIVGSNVHCKCVHGKYHKSLKHFYTGISVRTKHLYNMKKKKFRKNKWK